MIHDFKASFYEWLWRLSEVNLVTFSLFSYLQLSFLYQNDSNSLLARWINIALVCNGGCYEKTPKICRTTLNWFSSKCLLSPPLTLTRHNFFIFALTIIIFFTMIISIFSSFRIYKNLYSAKMRLIYHFVRAGHKWSKRQSENEHRSIHRSRYHT